MCRMQNAWILHTFCVTLLAVGSKYNRETKPKACISFKLCDNVNMILTLEIPNQDYESSFTSEKAFDRLLACCTSTRIIAQSMARDLKFTFNDTSRRSFLGGFNSNINNDPLQWNIFQRPSDNPRKVSCRPMNSWTKAEDYMKNIHRNDATKRASKFIIGSSGNRRWSEGARKSKRDYITNPPFLFD